MANKYIDKEYLLEQFKNYDSEVAEHKYSQSSVTVDSALNGNSDNPVKNSVIKTALDDKQNKLVAGSNITINNSTNTISATNTNKLDDLIDTNISEPSNGQGLIYNNATGKWENATIQAGSQYTLPTASTEVLGGVKVDGTSITIDNEGVISSSGSSDLSELNDVVITSLLNNDVLKYNATTEKWENGESTDILNYEETLDILGLPPNPIYRFRIATPIMTSDTTPSGEVSCSSYYNGYPPYQAFQQVENLDRGWVSSNDTVGAWIKYDFISKKPVIGKLYVQNRNESNVRAVKTFKFQASDDDSTWIDLKTCDGLQNSPASKYEFIINNQTGYRYYRLLITEVWDSSYIGFGDIRMYEKYLA